MVTVNPAGDFVDVVDGLEAVTLYRRGTSTTVTITHALHRPVGRSHRSEAAASDGRVLLGEKTWHLPLEECATQPAIGDWISDSAAERWTIMEVTRATLGDRWQCRAINLAVAHHLDCWVAIEQAVYTKTDSGTVTKTWATSPSGLRARIVTDLVEMIMADGARQTQKQYMIYLGEDVALDQTHRIRGPNGSYYRIVSYSGAADLTEPHHAPAEDR